MKSIIVAIILICGQLAHSNTYKNIQITNTDVVNQLDHSEASKLGFTIDQFVNQNIFAVNIDAKRSDIQVTYSCSTAPFDKVFCNITINSSVGVSAIMAVTYNREIDEVIITDSSLDI